LESSDGPAHAVIAIGARSDGGPSPVADLDGKLLNETSRPIHNNRTEKTFTSLARPKYDPGVRAAPATRAQVTPALGRAGLAA
jgi:hypothetical protein